MLFSKIDTRKLKICIVTVAALFLAACQTTGLKPGAIETGFPPSGWETQRSGNKVAYLCPKSKCGSGQLVVVSPLKIRGDLETAIRRNHLSAELLNSITNVIEVASKRSIDYTRPRKISTRNYTGFEYLVTLKGRNNKRVYLAIRDIIQKDRGVSVVSAALNRGTARRNLRRYLAQTNIRRVN